MEMMIMKGVDEVGVEDGWGLRGEVFGLWDERFFDLMV